MSSETFFWNSALGWGRGARALGTLLLAQGSRTALNSRPYGLTSERHCSCVCQCDLGEGGVFNLRLKISKIEKSPALKLENLANTWM